jgi:hypothetical protein
LPTTGCLQSPFGHSIASAFLQVGSLGASMPPTPW